MWAHLLFISSVSYSSFVKVSRAVAGKNSPQPAGGWALCHTVSLPSPGRNKHGFPSVSLCIAGAQPAARLHVEPRAASSACSYRAAGRSPARRLPPKHVDAHAAFSSAAKLILSKSRDQGPHKEPTPFSLGDLSALPIGNLLRAWKFHGDYSQV